MSWPTTADLPHFGSQWFYEPCKVCSYGSEYVGRPTGSLGRVASAAKAGCPVCGLVLVSAQALTQWPLYDVDTHQWGDPSVHFSLSHPDKGLRNMELFTMPDAPKCSLSVVEVRRDLREQRGDRYLPILSSWLQECMTQHGCSTSRGPLPTRVLDLNTESPGTVRLYVTRKEPAHYVALSHCWGADRDGHVCTTTENLLERQNGIRMEDLPKKYTEAIHIARGLKVRYLW